MTIIRYSLPKKIRICPKEHFARIFEFGQNINSGFIKIFYLKINAGQGKIGFAAGKKIGGAVFRNSCKRRMREIFRLNQHQISQEYDIIFLAKPKLMQMDFWLTNQKMLLLLKSCGLYKES